MPATGRVRSVCAFESGTVEGISDENMTGKTIILWLKSDRKTIQEVDRQEALKHISYADSKGGRHYVYIHNDGELYTTHHFIPAKQLEQIVERLKKP